MSWMPVVRKLCNRIGVSSVVCPSGLSHGPRTGQGPSRGESGRGERRVGRAFEETCSIVRADAVR
jgi:hypothetical protein